MRALGITCTANHVLLTLCVDGDVVDTVTARLEPPKNLEAGAGLWEFVEELRRTFKAARCDRAALLMPEHHRGAYTKIRPRVVLETLCRLAAARDDVPLVELPRPTVRAALDLPRKGGLSKHVDAVFAEPVGPYWGAGRGEAALAAMTIEQDS